MLIAVMHTFPMKSLLVFTEVWDIRSNAVTLAFVISLYLKSVKHAEPSQMGIRAQLYE